MQTTKDGNLHPRIAPRVNMKYRVFSKFLDYLSNHNLHGRTISFAYVCNFWRLYVSHVWNHQFQHYNVEFHVKYSVMSYATLILYYHTSMLTLHNTTKIIVYSSCMYTKLLTHTLDIYMLNNTYVKNKTITLSTPM